MVDRDHWNRRYTDRPWPSDPSSWLVRNADLLPETGRALDVAGGTGRNAIWLARRGWSVTIVDVSSVGLSIALEKAESLRALISTCQIDLSMDPLPEGPWNLVMIFHYLDRDILVDVARALRPGGILIGALATITNLERNERPPLPYLLEEAELPGLLGELELVRYEEGWMENRHDARFIARRPL